MSAGISGGEYKERVQEGECGRNIVYSCIKIRKMISVETILGTGEER
jgi:hypothetical protein